MRNLLARIDLSYVYAFLGEATLSLTFILYMVLARVVGPEQYGIFAAATALGGILNLFIQFGMPPLMTREVAANPEESPKYTINFLLLEILNGLLILLLLWPLTQLLGFDQTGVIICYLVILSEICRSAKQTLRSVFRGLGQFRAETISVSLERSLVFLFVAIVLLLSKNLVWAVATLVLVRGLDILGLLYYLSKRLSIFSPISIKSLKQVLLMAYPFALSGVLWILYYQVDILMLKVLASPLETGLYSASYRIIEIFLALPRVIFYVSFTRFTRTHATQSERLPGEVYKSTRLLLIGVVPVLIAAGMCQTLLVQTIYGEAFNDSVKSLGILLPSISLKMFGSLIEFFLQATGREKSLPRLLGIALIVNLIANAILIPHFESLGAAIATLLSEFVFSMMGLNVMRHLGYKQVVNNLRLIALLSLILTSIPYLILIEWLEPALAICLMVGSTIALIGLMNPSRFLETSDQ
jgi:O-antigen/teichoic acid export membrane protein